MVFIIFYNGKSYEHPYEHVMKNPMNMGWFRGKGSNQKPLHLRNDGHPRLGIVMP
jgi:hypothetical protein